MHIHNIQSLLLIETVVLYYAAPLPHCRAPSCVSTGSSGPGLSPHGWSAQTNITYWKLNELRNERNRTELNHGSQHCTSFFMEARLFNGTPLIRAQASMLLRCWTGGSPLLEVKQTHCKHFHSSYQKCNPAYSRHAYTHRSLSVYTRFIGSIRLKSLLTLLFYWAWELHFYWIGKGGVTWNNPINGTKIKYVNIRIRLFYQKTAFANAQCLDTFTYIFMRVYLRLNLI